MIKPYKQTPSARPTKIRDLPRIEESSLIAPNAALAALLLSIVVPFAYFLSGTKNKARYKLTIGTNAAAFFGIMLVACGFMFSGNAQAAEAAAETANAAGGLSTGMGYLAAALITCLILCST